MESTLADKMSDPDVSPRTKSIAVGNSRTALSYLNLSRKPHKELHLNVIELCVTFSRNEYSRWVMFIRTGKFGESQALVRKEKVGFCLSVSSSMGICWRHYDNRVEWLHNRSIIDDISNKPPNLSLVG